MIRKTPTWGLVVRPTDAGGGYLAPHISKIEDALNGSADQATLHYTLHGECQIQLASELDETEAHALATRLNGLTDERGRPVLEVEITSASPRILKSYPASDFTLSR